MTGGGLHRFGLLLSAFPEGGDAFVSVSYPGLVGVVTGVNRHGLAVANMVVAREEGIQPDGIPYPFLQRSLLETCRDRHAARKALEASARTVPQNLALADREGGSFLEVTGASVRMRPSRDGTTGGTNSFGEDRDPQDAGERYRTLCACCGRRPVSAERLLEGLCAAAIRSMNVQCCVFRLGAMKAMISCNGFPAFKGPFVEVDLDALLKP